MEINHNYGKKLHCLGLILALWTFPFLNSTFAATFTVCPSGCDYVTIQSAIDASASGDTISISAGTYTENLSISKNIIISGNSSTSTIIDGNATATVVTVASNVVVTLSDLNITNGYTETNGAGLANEGNSTLQRVIVSSNTAKQGGGGIFNTGILTVSNSTITDNTGMTLGTGFIGGAGIASSGLTAVVNISNSTISNNSLNRPGTDDRGGGGISSKNGDVTITDSLIDSNGSGYSAGGIYFAGSGAVLTIYRTRITGNETGTYSNRNTGRGGGLSLRGGSTTLIDQSLIDGNISASSGGGIHADANVTITNSTISGNQAVGSAGGILADGSLTVDSVTIVNNSSPLGGGFSGRSTALLYASNTVIADNTATTGSDCYGSISIDPSAIVLVETLSAECTISGGGVPLTGTDPLLGPLDDNGGSTFTHLPNVGSVLIDSGSTTLTVDQRGELRPSGSGADIGAVETQSVAPPPSGHDISISASPTSFNTDTNTFNDVNITAFTEGAIVSAETVLTLSYAGGFESGPMQSTNCSAIGDTQIVCNLGYFGGATGSSLRFQLRFITASSPGLVIAITSQEEDINPLNNTVTIPVTLRTASADIGASISVVSGVNTEGYSLRGEPVTYRLTTRNYGLDKALDVVSRVQLPVDWELISLRSNCVNTIENTINYVDCTHGDMRSPLEGTPTEAFGGVEAIPGNASLSITVSSSTLDENIQNNEITYTQDIKDFLQELSAEALPMPNQILSTENVVARFDFRGDASPTQAAEIKITIPKVEGLVGVSGVMVGGDGKRNVSCPIQEGTNEFVSLCTKEENGVTPVYVVLTFNQEGTYEVIGSIRSIQGFDSDASNDIAISTIVEVATPPFSPIYVRGIEVTQAVQNWENGVDLYKGKRTVVRVSLQDLSGIGMSASGKLVGSIGGLPLVNGTLFPFSSKEVVGEVSELRKNSLDFLLPISWTTLTSLRLDFEANVMGRQVVCQEPDPVPNCAVTVQFIDSVRPKINLYGVRYWEDELINILLDSGGDEPPTGTVTLTIDGNEIKDIPADATATVVDNLVEQALGLSSAQVKVTTRKTGVKGLSDSQYGWRISLRTRTNYPPAQLTSSLTESNATATIDKRSDGGGFVVPTIADISEQRARLLTILPTDKILGLTSYLWSFEYQPTAREINARLKELKYIELATNPQVVAEIRYAGYARGTIPEHGYALGVSQGSVFSWYDSNVTATTENTGTAIGYSRNVGAHEAYHSVGKDHAGVVDANEDPDDGLDPDVVLGLCGSTSRVGSTKHPYIETPNLSATERPTIGPLSIGANREIWGFDTRLFSVETNLRIVNPRKTWALMSYCGGSDQVKWPSSFGYLAAAIGIKQGFLGVPSKPADFTGAILLVSGGIGEVVNLSMTPLIGSLRDTDNSGTINLTLIDSLGNQVDSLTVPVLTSFTPDVAPSIDPTNLPPTDDEFQAALRNPGGIGTELIVSRYGIEIARVTASPSPPMVTLLTPVASNQVEQPGVSITWLSSDIDGDPLTSYVLYSPDDGTTWKVLANGIHGSQYFASISTLGQSETARFRVIVSDGFRSAEVISPSMVVPNSPPTVLITTVTTPIMAPDVPIMLEASVFDTEDGLINQESLTWSSSLDGPLGQGESVYLEGGKLTRGCHIIRAEITDSAGDIGIGTLAMGIDIECQEIETNGLIWLQPFSTGTSQTGEFSSTIPGYDTISLIAGQDLKIQAPPGQYQLNGQGDLSQSISGVTCTDPSGDTLPNIQPGVTMISLAANESIECKVNLSPDIVDNDNDGVEDDLDLCLDTPANEKVVVSGCSVPQILSERCDSQKSKNHGLFVSCVTRVLNDLLKDELITRKERTKYLSDAVHAN